VDRALIAQADTYLVGEPFQREGLFMHSDSLQFRIAGDKR
jgi:hypothetical protein